MSFKDIALPLAKLGIPVTPLKGTTKDAFLAGWQISATTDENQILAWDAQYGDVNCGAVAKGTVDSVWFFEADSKDVLDRIQAETGHDLIDEVKTYMVRSRQGRGHLYFRATPAALAMGNLSQAYVKGGDFSVRVRNQYVVAAGSIHPITREPYVCLTPDVSPVGAPDWFVAWLETQRLTVKTESGTEAIPMTESGTVPHGYIHGWMVHQAGKLRSIGLDVDKIEDTLLDLVQKYCEPPIDESKVRQVARSFGKYDPTPTSTLPVTLNQKPDPASQAALQQQPIDISNWRDYFRSIGEMEDRPIDEIIKGALQEGICFFGANPGDGKTLTALAFAKAICTGEPLFGLPQYPVAKPRPVIYLIPETRDPAFRKRCEAFRIPDDKTKFMARTTSAGPSLLLDDPILRQAVAETKAVVFLDTAARFMRSNDENSAAQNRLLVNEVIQLLSAGAVCVILVHHATKASQTEAMTLENMLRGTGDLAAMCDQVYGIRKDRRLYANGNGPMEIELASLKDREQIGQLTTLRLAASKKAEPGFLTPTVSIITETGNFRVVNKGEVAKRETESLVTIVQNDPHISDDDLAQQSGLKVRTAKARLNRLGWRRTKGGKDGSSPWYYGATKAQPEPEPMAA